MKSDQVIERIKARVAAVDPSAPRTVEGVFQLNVTSSGEGDIHLIIDLKKLTVSEGQASSPDVTVTVCDEYFLKVGSKQVSAEDAISGGKVQIEGDKSLASALISKLAQ